MASIAEQVRSLFQPMFEAGQKDLPGFVTALIRLLNECPWVQMETDGETIRFAAADGSTSAIAHVPSRGAIRLPLSALAIAFIRRTGKDDGDYIYAQNQTAHFTFDDGLDLWIHVQLLNEPMQQSFRLDRVEETPGAGEQMATVAT